MQFIMNELHLTLLSLLCVFAGVILGYFLQWDTRQELKKGASIKELLWRMTKY